MHYCQVQAPSNELTLVHELLLKRSEGFAHFAFESGICRGKLALIHQTEEFGRLENSP